MKATEQYFVIILQLNSVFFVNLNFAIRRDERVKIW